MRLRQSITIAAPIERVFAFIDDPGNYPVLRPQIVRVLGVQGLPNGGREIRYLTRDDWDEHLFEWVSRDLEYDPPRRTVTEETARATFGWEITDARSVTSKALRPTELGVLLSVERDWYYHLHGFGRLRLTEFGLYWDQRQNLRRYLRAVKSGVEQEVSG
jgi:Polyketide cyclase / dehydrase and lipid transport